MMGLVLSVSTFDSIFRSYRSRRYALYITRNCIGSRSNRVVSMVTEKASVCSISFNTPLHPLIFFSW